MWRWLLVAALAARSLAACPRLCECKWRSGKESAVCRGAGLDALPRPLDPGTQLLDLTGNRLAALPDDAFAAAGLVNLQRIYLAECGLRTLRRHTFRNQTNLVELDLSRNRLEAVPTHALADARELRELRLAGNPISKLRHDAFTALTQLVRLDLSGCRIADVDARAFSGLEASLEFLELDNNNLRALRAPTLNLLRALHGLELANNPWDCTCDLRPLRDWMVRRNVPATVVPECARPERLAGQPWDRLDLDEFACPPEVSATASHASGYEGGEVTLACRVSGEPAPRVRWLRAGRALANTSSSPPSPGPGAREVVLRGEGQVNRLTIRAADVQDAGAYTCTAENRAGRAEASVTLAVERRTWSVAGELGARALMAGLVVSAVLVFGSCVLVVCAYDARRKRQAERWNEQIATQSRRDESYEKIEAEQKELEATRGHYRNVPSHDPEDEPQGYRRDEAATPKSPPEVAGVSWQQPAGPPPRTPPACRWSLGPSAQATTGANAAPLETDLHIPRLPDFTIRDYRNGGDFASTITPIEFNNNHSSSDVNHLNNNNLPTAAAGARHHKIGANAAAARRYGRAGPAHDRLDNDLSGSDSEKNYPDLIEMSALGTELYMRAERERPQRRRDPPDYAFCTLPRKRLPNVGSTDSRSPLLADSRCGSSGGESAAATLERRASSEWQHRTPQDQRRGRSSSILNLSDGRVRVDSSSPVCEPTPSATPLLDLAGLRAASEYARAADAADVAYAQEDAQYDLHASQLERFLQEYVTLREQLSKMKETRESLQRSRPVGSEHDDFKGNVKGRPSVAVTAASSSATSATSDWMSLYRTS